MSKTKHALTFRIFQNGQFLREETLSATVIKIGKVPSAHLRIDDDSVSRMHAVLEVNPQEVCLIDLGSTRGTFVNGKKINKASLQTGDVIQLGDVRIELAVGAPSLATTSAIAPTASGTIAPRSSDARASGAGVAAATTPRTPPPIPAVVAAAAASYAPVLRSVPSSTPAPPIARPDLLAARPALPLDISRPTSVEDDLAPARAVEIAAMLGDSVIDVKHCIDPHGGKVRPATWGLLATGIVLLLISAGAFFASVHVSADNEARRDTWVRLQHRPAHAFRPEVLGAGVDWLAFGGLVLGLAGVAASAWRIRGERANPYYRIGTAPGVELAVAQAPAAAFPLVAPAGDGFVFNFGAGIDGELTVDGVTTPLAQLTTGRPSASVAGAIEVPIPPRARIRARAGQATFLISSVARPHRAAAPLLAHVERRALSYFAGSLAVHLGVLALLQMMPPDAAMSPIDLPIDELLRMRIQNPVQADANPERQPDAPGDQGGASQQAGAVSMAMAEGAAGDPSRTEHARQHVAHHTDQAPANLRDAILLAQNAGPLGSEALRDATQVLGATSNYAEGFDPNDLNGSITGPDGNGGNGNFGGGVHGLATAGGCLGDPCGLIASAGYRTIGVGGPAGGGYSIGSRDGRPGRNHVPLIPHFGEAVISSPTYDKSIVRRYIRQHLNEITYCYEKQLLAHPSIGGDVKIQFFISPSGSVQASSGEGFDPDVTSCLAGVIKSIAFPPPREAGVQVSYPFHFHAPGA